MALITELELKALKASDHGRRLTMGRSLYGGVSVGSNGTVSVHVSWRYKVGGKVREKPIGTWKAKDGMSLKAIFAERERLAVALRDGTDPVAQREAEREAKAKQTEIDRIKAEADHQQALLEQQQRLEVIAAQQARQTVRNLFALWHRLELARRDDGGAETLRSFTADVFPLLGDMAAEDVKKAHIRQVLDSIQARATPGKPMVRTQKKTLSDLRQMFAFALDRDLLEADPTASVKKKALGKDVERERHFSEAELIEFFQKLPASGLAETSQLALLIQLSTVARIGEVLGARWADVDLERRTWRLPDTKNGKDHTVTLSDYAARQFEQLHQATGLTPWCFPASRIDGPVCEKTVTKQVADRQRPDASPMSGRTKQTTALVIGEKWTPHDLRRTGATHMAKLGVLDGVIEKCLNHTDENKVRRIYNREQYAQPMRDAWHLLGERLALFQAQAEGKATNVVTLRAA
ncbi:MAG: tyrosine-type recombinase/integrase [Burkholderiaceae bacterium]